MLKLGLFVRLEAKPGKEEDVAAFLKQGLQLANQESTTPLWFALRLDKHTFAIFDAFADEPAARRTSNGPIAKALMAKAPNLLASPPVIEASDVLVSSSPNGTDVAARRSESLPGAGVEFSGHPDIFGSSIGFRRLGPAPDRGGRST